MTERRRRRLRIREVRERHGFSQAWVAGELERLTGHRWHQAQVAKIEAGERRLTVSEALHFAAVLRASPVHIFVDPNRTAMKIGRRRVSTRDLRRWVRGERPLLARDASVFFTEVPKEEDGPEEEAR
jgi:transcriptional regulator with XRE-family HTH domain